MDQLVCCLVLYVQVYKYHNMLQKMGVALCMPNARAL